MSLLHQSSPLQEDVGPTHSCPTLFKNYSPIIMGKWFCTIWFFNNRRVSLFSPKTISSQSLLTKQVLKGSKIVFFHLSIILAIDIIRSVTPENTNLAEMTKLQNKPFRSILLMTPRYFYIFYLLPLILLIALIYHLSCLFKLLCLFCLSFIYSFSSLQSFELTPEDVEGKYIAV